MRVVVILITAVLLIPLTARAQGVSAYVSFVPAAAVFNDNTSLALSGTFGVQLNRAVAFEMELTAAPDFVEEPDFRILPLAEAISIFPIPRYDVDSRAVIFATNARISIPTTVPRVDPSLVVGGGLAHLRRDVSYDYRGLPIPLLEGAVAFPFYEASAELALALTLGGGVRIDLWKRVLLDVDLRYYRLLAQRDRNMGRFGAGVGYQF